MHTFPCTAARFRLQLDVPYMFRAVLATSFFLPVLCYFYFLRLAFLALLCSLPCQLTCQALSLLCPERQQKLQTATLKDPLL